MRFGRADHQNRGALALQLKLDELILRPRTPRTNWRGWRRCLTSKLGLIIESARLPFLCAASLPRIDKPGLPIAYEEREKSAGAPGSESTAVGVAPP
jgi:hypothetical protein